MRGTALDVCGGAVLGASDLLCVCVCVHARAYVYVCVEFNVAWIIC